MDDVKFVGLLGQNFRKFDHSLIPIRKRGQIPDCRQGILRKCAKILQEVCKHHMENNNCGIAGQNSLKNWSVEYQEISVPFASCLEDEACAI